MLPRPAYELALTDENFKFPQIWRSNIAVDQRLPWGWTGTAEFLYNRDVNGVYYINANLPAAQGRFAGADSRPRWVGPSCSGAPVSPCVTRLNNQAGNQVQNAIVLKNQNEGRSWNVAGSLEKTTRGGLWVKAAYSYGEARNTVDPGSIAFGSWNNNPHAGDPNNPGIAYAISNPGHRVFAAASYTREYFGFGKTTMSVFWEAMSPATFNVTDRSYTFAGDLNGDGGTSNDLIYIHRDVSEMNFQAFTLGTRTFTAAEQAQAWNAYIEQDAYLSKRRGQYAERGALLAPIVRRIDASLSQDIFRDLGGRRHGLQARVDVLNFGNLLKSEWGVGQRYINTQPLTNPGVDAAGRATYRLRVVNNALMAKSLENTAGLSDVYRVQFSLRYSF